MITHPRVFDDEFVPHELHHREGAVDALSRAFDPAVSGRAAENVLISGPSGVGKTVLARHTIGRLRQHADITATHVECLGTTKGAILRQVLEAVLGRGHEQVAQNTPVAEVRRHVREAIDRPVILVLDEADALPDTGALDDLVDLPQLSVIAIAHEEDRWLSRCSDDVRRAMTTSIHLDRYHVDELREILRARANRGLSAGVVSDRRLEQIADGVAGVARFGIQSLRAAAEIAGERDHRKILEADVDDSFDRARYRIRRSNLRSLPLHHHVLYAIVHEAEGGEISGGDLHARYDAIAEHVYRGSDLVPIGKRARRNKLQKLREYDLVERDGQTYRVADDTITATISVPDTAANSR